jgi:hypothetical protein
VDYREHGKKSAPETVVFLFILLASLLLLSKSYQFAEKV